VGFTPRYGCFYARLRTTNAIAKGLTNCGDLTNANVNHPQSCGLLAKANVSHPQSCGLLANANVNHPQSCGTLTNAFVTFPPYFGLATTVATLPPNMRPLPSLRVTLIKIHHYSLKHFAYEGNQIRRRTKNSFKTINLLTAKHFALC
jgi:hypothetical protein